LWNDKLSEVAAAYAAKCIWNHNPKIKGKLGESIYMTLGPLIVSHPFSVWFDQNVNYNFYSHVCNAGKLCGGYTQMMWANTSFIGCAAQYCPSVSNFDAQNATMLVCNYYPPGNIEGQSPYKEGPPCTVCPEETQRCWDNYCDRGTDIAIEHTDASLATIFNITANSGGFTKPSSVPLLLAGLTVFYFFIPGTFTEC
ncbi:peptidase inhibitor 16-like, partial [Tachysurus ichikawai]